MTPEEASRLSMPISAAAPAAIRPLLSSDVVRPRRNPPTIEARIPGMRASRTNGLPTPPVRAVEATVSRAAEREMISKTTPLGFNDSSRTTVATTTNTPPRRMAVTTPGVSV